MLSKVWLLGPHKTYPCSLPKAMAWRAGRAWLGPPWLGSALLGLAQLSSARLSWQRSPRASAQTLSQEPGTARTALCSRGWGGHLCTLTQPEASRR